MEEQLTKKEKAKLYYQRNRDAIRKRCRDLYRRKHGLPCGNYAIIPLDENGNLELENIIIRN